MEGAALVVGRTYYRLTFSDRDMTMPGVKPLVFVGRVTTEEGTSAFVFQDTVSYVRFGSILDASEDHDEMESYFITELDVVELHDVASIAAEVASAARRASLLNHPVLPVLKAGWNSA